ncbi:hypothetical protein FRC03_000586 [Tulasnella sp. 419]|nr:hypothetical protein FRC03_000586 [Tulasnella sp. 419]
MLPLLGWIIPAIASSVVTSEKVWTSLPIVQPPDLVDPFQGKYQYHYAPVWVGNPPQLQNLAISISSVPIHLFGEECAYCPENNTFESELSNTLKINNQLKWPYTTKYIRAYTVNDDISFEGILTSHQHPFGLVDSLSEQMLLRFREGLLGLAVNPKNQTTYEYSLLARLHQSANLLNPVVGLKLGGANPRLTIGALDPNDYDGEINWVERVESVQQVQTTILVEALRGRDDRTLPYSYPLIGTLSTLDQQIFMPDDSVYFLNESYIGPQTVINMFPSGGFAVGCNITLRNRAWDDVYLPFSVDINGVNYPVDSKDLIRPKSGLSTNITCRTAFQNSTSAEPLTLGLSFLRSVYLAYRFPTEDCPYAHYGFAYPKGANRTSATISQKPRTTPKHASQCLQLVTPTTTPSSKKVDFMRKYKYSQFGPHVEQTTYEVWGRPNDARTPLIGVKELPPRAVDTHRRSIFWW